MKKIVVYLVLLFSAKTGSAQENRVTNEVKYLMEQSNLQQFEKVYAHFNANMKSALTTTQFSDFMKSIGASYGKMTNFERIETSNGWDIFKSTFEKGVLELKIALDEKGEIAGFSFVPYQEKPKTKQSFRNTTPMDLPFKDKWTVFWGGDSLKDNAHANVRAQKNAFDFIIMDEQGKTHKNNGTENEDYYAFGKEIIAPCDAEVVEAIDGIKDNTPGDMNLMYVPGNSVVLKTAAKEYVFFAHFKKGSLRVKQGEKIKKGQVLGLCGNSGNSSEPHLHFHLQDHENINKATGVKCFFQNPSVTKNGTNTGMKDYSPVKGDVLMQN